MYQPSMKVEMHDLETKKKELTQLIANSGAPPPLLHPAMAAAYEKQMMALYKALQQEESRAEAAEVFRHLVRQVTLTPGERGAQDLSGGELAQLLAFMSNRKASELAEAASFFQEPAR